VDVIRSEEELRRTSAWRPVERLRVRKRIVAEQQVVTVELRREELVVEREPVVDAPATGADPGPAEPLVLTLSEEQAVITTVVVPVERVRVVVDRTTEEHELRTTLRSERIDVVQEPPT
jgi:uncharacterized protein (TIGR02271 family)